MKFIGSLTLLSILTFFIACGQPSYQQGAALYDKHCAGCHMEEGQGLGALYPPLANSDWLKNDPMAAACAIRYGLEGEIVVNDTIYNQPMLAIIDLSEVQIVNIINYINQAWGNDYGTITVGEVKTALEECRKDG